jgi:hypothetical protein
MRQVEQIWDERTLDGDLSGVKDKILEVQDVAVVCDNTGDDGDAGLDSQVESALLEG